MHDGTRDAAAMAAHRSATFAFALLATMQATLIFTIALIMIPLPAIASEFALSETQMLLLQVAYGLPFSGLLLFGGRLSDRFGGRRMLVVGVVSFGLASLVAPLVQSFELLTAMRFLQGAGGAVTAPAALAVARALFTDPAAFGRAMATWGGVSVLGATLGFVSSGVVADFVSWRWMFAVPIAVSALVVAAVPLLPAARPAADREGAPGLDPAGALLATFGIVLTSYGIIASHESAWASPGVLGPLVAGVVLLAVFFALERKARDPLLPPDFLLDASRIVGLGGMLLAAAGSLLIEYVLLVYLQTFRGWTSLDTALAFLPFAVGLIASNTVAAPVVSRLGPALTAAAGFLIGATGLGLLGTLDRETPYVTVLVPGEVLLAIGMALAFAGAAVLSTANVPPQRMGLAGGVMNTAMELGPTVGFAAFMAVAAMRADPVAGYASAFATAAAAFGAAALVALAVARRSPARAA